MTGRFDTVVRRMPGGPRLEAGGPRVRLGLVWTATALLATAISPMLAAAVFAAVALGAAGQATRAWRKESRRAFRPVAVIGAVVIVLAAGAGGVVMAIAVATVLGASFGAARLGVGGEEWDAALTALVAVAVGLAGGAVPLARAELGLIPSLVLLMTVLVGEASWFLVGIEPRTRFDAVAGSTLAIAVFTLGVAAVLVPPFRGMSPWVLGGVAAVLVPVGPRYASVLLPRPGAVAPALRRLDAFMLCGPAWVVVATLMLDLR